MRKNRNIPYYLMAITLFVILKFSFSMAGNRHLAFLLKPTDAVIGLLTGSDSVYIANCGYYHAQLNVIIDKSCSGFNFWVLCFLLFTYPAIKHVDKPLSKLIVLPASLGGAYLLTLFANTSRIFVSIVVQAQAGNLLPGRQHIVHEAIGIITNLTFLVSAYILIEKLLSTNKRRHAQDP